MIKSLNVLQHPFANSLNQLAVLENDGEISHPSFKDKLGDIGMFPLQSAAIEIFQVNIGKMCNQACRHCHVVFIKQREL